MTRDFQATGAPIPLAAGDESPLSLGDGAQPGATGRPGRDLKLLAGGGEGPLLPTPPATTHPEPLLFYPVDLDLSRQEQDEIVVRAVKLWAARRSQTIDDAKFSREMGYLEQGCPLCESCEFASGTVLEEGTFMRLCGECNNAGHKG